MGEYDDMVAAHATLAGKYTLERVLGHGGMGVVVAAMHQELHERVAIKLIYRDIAAVPGMRERFINEARASARLKGPHVARVRDVEALDDGTPFLVMEYLTGTDLDKVLKGGPLAIDLAVDYVLQACDAIAEAHSVGIVHRDLKPANLFVAQQRDGSDMIKVVDFGISTGAQPNMRITSEDSVLGTPAYMSPEQMRSARLADARSDIWSIGAMLYELIEGKTPFTGESFAALCVQIAIHEPMPMKQPVPPGLGRAIAKCLRKDSMQRHPQVVDLANALLPYTRDIPGAVARIDRMERVQKRDRTVKLPLYQDPSVTSELPAPAEPVLAAIRVARERVAMPAMTALPFDRSDEGGS